MTFPIRHAGQYYDQEVGIFYNYFRDYDPITGRYVESDSIGLDGGLNTFGYVGGDALHLVDPRCLAMALPAGAGEALNLALAIGLISNMPDTKPVANAVFNQSPVRGSAENSLISWRPNPFNNSQDNCNQARQKLKELQALKKWRMDDIKKHNPQYEKGKRLTP